MKVAVSSIRVQNIFSIYLLKNYHDVISNQRNIFVRSSVLKVTKSQTFSNIVRFHKFFIEFQTLTCLVFRFSKIWIIFSSGRIYFSQILGDTHFTSFLVHILTQIFTFWVGFPLIPGQNFTNSGSDFHEFWVRFSPILD